MKPSKENSMLMDIKYIKENRREGNPDCLYVLWKDLDTNSKYVQEVTNPKMDIYFEKPEYRNHDYNKVWEYRDRLEKRTVIYKDIPKEIAKEAGPSAQNMLRQAYETRNFNAIKQIQLYPYVFGSDLDIRAWYRIQWLLKLNNNRIKKIDKGFLDIEADSYGHVGFPDARDCPINAVNIINARDKISYTFVCTQGRCRSGEMYESQQKQFAYLKSHINEFVDELHHDFDDKFGRLDYKIYFYDDERKMLVHMFQMINIIKLDMIGIWNMSFDMPYIMERMRVLGLDPVEIMTHPDFKYKECYFHEDTKNFNVKDKNDYMRLSSYTMFLCQMELYAAERKGQQELRSATLDAVSTKELEDKKLDYHEDGNIKTIAYTNVWNFIKYNIKDTLLQYGIEMKVSDFDTLYVNSYENATVYESVYKQTVTLRSVQYKSYYDQGLMVGNNMNIFNASSEKKSDEDDDSDVGYEGALVADPTYNAYINELLYGRHTNNIIRYSIDMDMSAFYPSSIIEMNIDPSCLIFKVIVPLRTFTKDKLGVMKKVYHPNDKTVYDDEEDIAKEIFDNFQTGNVLTTGHKWLHLPSSYKCFEYLKRKLG